MSDDVAVLERRTVQVCRACWDIWFPGCHAYRGYRRTIDCFRCGAHVISNLYATVLVDPEQVVT